MNLSINSKAVLKAINRIYEVLKYSSKVLWTRDPQISNKFYSAIIIEYPLINA